MRQEARRRMRPERVVQSPRDVRIRTGNNDLAPEAVCLRGNTASGLQLVRDVRIEVDLGHVRLTRLPAAPTSSGVRSRHEKLREQRYRPARRALVLATAPCSACDVEMRPLVLRRKAREKTRCGDTARGTSAD